MAPTLSLPLRLYDREETSSILAADQDEFALSDDCNSPTSRWRHSCPEPRSTTTATRWSSHLKSLPSSVINASTALTTRAKELATGKSTYRAINHLRKSLVDVSSRTERSLWGSIPTKHGVSEASIDQVYVVDGFDNKGDQPESESNVEEEVRQETKLKRLSCPSRGPKAVPRDEHCRENV